MAQATLVSLAILKVNWDVFGKDYVENFVPFVAEAVRLSTAAAVSLPELQQSVVDTFGLRRSIFESLIAGFAKQDH